MPEKTGTQMKAWEKKKESPERVAEFQENMASFVLQSLLTEFPDIR